MKICNLNIGDAFVCQFLFGNDIAIVIEKIVFRGRANSPDARRRNKRVRNNVC